jgi:hypothetical protein
MASQKVVDLIPCKEDREFHLKQDPVNIVVARMEALADSVDTTAVEMKNMFYKFIRSAKSKDFSQLSDTITMVTRMETVVDSVDKTADKMGDMFHKLIQCAKYQDAELKDFSQLSETITMVQEQLENLKILLDTTESKDSSQLSDTITMVQKQLEKLKFYLSCMKILLDIPEA